MFVTICTATAVVKLFVQIVANDCWDCIQKYTDGVRFLAANSGGESGALISRLAFAQMVPSSG